MKRLRRAGSPWRLLAHDWAGKQSGGLRYGTSRNVYGDTNFSRDTELRHEQSIADGLRTEVHYPRSEFDELVVGQWLHVEQMDTGFWWMNVGGVTLHVWANRDGQPRKVTVHGPETWAEPVEGCEYDLDWRDEAAP